jgi:hypothetical protein
MHEEHTDSIRSWAQTLDGVNKRTGKKTANGHDTTKPNDALLRLKGHCLIRLDVYIL